MLSKNLQKSRKRFNLLFNTALVIVVMTFVFTIVSYVYIGVSVVDEVNENGGIGKTIGHFAAEIEKGYSDKSE